MRRLLRKSQPDVSAAVSTRKYAHAKKPTHVRFSLAALSLTDI